MSENLIPIAVSSELDTTGEERIHMANMAVSSFSRPVFLGLLGDLPDAHFANIIDYQYTVAGGVAPVVVTLISGSLPTGLSMDTNGRVTGTCAALGSFSWSLQAVDAVGTTVPLDDSSEITAVPILLTGDNGAFYGTPTNLLTMAGTWPILENVVADMAEIASTSEDGLVLAGRNPSNTIGIWRYSAGSYVAQTITGSTPGGTLAAVTSCIVSDDGEWVLVSGTDSRRIWVYKYNGSGYTFNNNDTLFGTNNRAICWNDARTKVAVALDNTTVLVYDFNSSSGVLTLDKTITGSSGTSGGRLQWIGDYLLNGRVGAVDSIRVLSYTTGAAVAALSDAVNPYNDWLWNGTNAYVLGATDIKTATLSGGVLTVNNTYAIGGTSACLLGNKDLSYILVPGSVPKLYSVSGAVLTPITAPSGVTVSGLWTGME